MDSGKSPLVWPFGPSDYPRALVTSLLKQAQANGYEGHVTLHLDYMGGQSTDVTITAQLQDFAGGNEWHADIAYEGWLPPIPGALLVQIRHRTLYGQVQDGKRLDRTEFETRILDGQRKVEFREGRAVPNHSRPERTTDEYERRLRLYFQSGVPATESDAGQEYDVLQEPLLSVPCMVGMMLMLSSGFWLPEA